MVQDGHKSHMTVDLIDLARANDVILFNLPPHTTHATQPLDKSIFKPLKSAFANALKSVTFARQDFTLSKSDFPRMFTEPYDKTCTPFRVKQSFADAGICPFDPSKIKVDVLGPSEHFQVTTTPPSSESAAEESPSTSGVTMATDTPGLVSPMASGSPVTTPLSTGSAHSLSSVNTPCNPLLAAGLIPESLADIFQVPERKVKETRQRITTKARVITGDEYTEELKKKEDEAQEKEKQRKKKEREEKKAAKERKKEAERNKMPRGQRQVNPRKNDTSGQSSSTRSAEGNSGAPLRPSCSRHPPAKIIESLIQPSSSSESEDDSCFKCGKKNPPCCDLDNNIDWISCRSCDQWYHVGCIDGNDVHDLFICHLCED